MCVLSIEHNTLIFFSVSKYIMSRKCPGNQYLSPPERLDVTVVALFWEAGSARMRVSD